MLEAGYIQRRSCSNGEGKMSSVVSNLGNDSQELREWGNLVEHGTAHGQNSEKVITT